MPRSWQRATRVTAASAITSRAPDQSLTLAAALAAGSGRYSGGSPIEIDARRAPGSEVRIEVRDREPGIDDVEHELVFDRFYRGGNRDGEAFGLGLSTVREIAVALDGEIELEPRPGGGTVAAIMIERQQEPE